MSYTISDFQEILAELTNKLELSEEDAKPCQLYDCGMANEHQTIELRNGEKVLHVADACNLANSIQSIETLLKLPKEDRDSDLLSLTLVRELGCVWEMIDNAVIEQRKQEVANSVGGKKSHRDNKEGGKLIKLWANTLKHPKSAVVAHQCFDASQANVVIDSEKLKSLELEMKEFQQNCPECHKSSDKAWAKVWSQCSGKVVFFALPTVQELKQFISELDGHYDYLIQRRKRLANHLGS